MLINPPTRGQGLENEQGTTAHAGAQGGTADVQKACGSSEPGL